MTELRAGIWRQLTAAVLMTALPLLHARCQPADTLVEAEQMPYFKGCETLPPNTPAKRACSNEALMAFVSSRFEYPEAAREQHIQGKVYVRFVVNESGQVVAPQVEKDIGGGCGEAALRIVTAMPDWEPAVHQGRRVNVWLRLPVSFFLKGEDESVATYRITWAGIRGSTTTRKTLKKALDQLILIRDPQGNAYRATELVFAYEHKNIQRVASSNDGAMNADIRKLVRHVSKGGRLTIRAGFFQKTMLTYLTQELEIR